MVSPQEEWSCSRRNKRRVLFWRPHHAFDHYPDQSPFGHQHVIDGTNIGPSRILIILFFDSSLRILGAITCILYLLSGFLFKDKTASSHKKASDEEAGSSSFAADKDADIKPVEKAEESTLKKTLLSPFKVIRFDVLKDTNFMLWCLADIVIELSYYVPLFFLPCKWTLKLAFYI